MLSLRSASSVVLSENEIELLKKCRAAKSTLFKFSIIDRGPGISPADLQMLFKPYYQIRPAETQAGQGSGLGQRIRTLSIKIILKFSSPAYLISFLLSTQIIFLTPRLFRTLYRSIRCPVTCSVLFCSVLQAWLCPATLPSCTEAS